VRTIKKIHAALYSPIADLTTYSPLPSRTISQIDPFLFLNHHGRQIYPANNNGLPFGPHPHRGMETVTFILEGDIKHQDSGGHESVIEAGGVQWMTAGRGLIHAEVSSEKFKREGGPLEILQLWVNLPSKLKMMAPNYSGLQKAFIPTLTRDQDNVDINIISGTWFDTPGAFLSITGISLATLYFKSGGKVDLLIPNDQNIFFYVIKGELMVNATTASIHQLVEFNNNAPEVSITAIEECILLIGYAKPLEEPVVAQGPFVMNTQQEITQAYQDYQDGKFGQWK
jgi:redox-sensitive bicupin YhaK (pirin superfamily)